MQNNQLDVYLNQHKVGYLTQVQQQLGFQYTPEWLTYKDAMPLSLSLPLQTEIFAEEKTRPFFANLLPEAQIRTYLARAIGVSEKNDFALLKVIAGETAGAVTLLPHDETLNQKGSYRLLNADKLQKTIAMLAKHPFLAGEKDVRLSLAGAQNKLPVYINNNKIYLPIGNYPSSHIIKPPLARIPDSVENEKFSMQLAALTGLPVPPTTIKQNPLKLYIIERYDRKKDNEGNLIRLHQEDFCQALSILPQYKYESEGGPTLVQCFNLIKQHSNRPAVDQHLLLQWIIFNYFIGNCDAHAKNIALMLRTDGIQLAPFYDLLCTAVYPDLSKKMAMKIGGENRLDWIQPRHWQRFAEQIQVKFDLINNLLQQMAIRLKHCLDNMPSTLKPLANNKTVQEIVVLIDKRTKKIFST